MSSDGAAQKFMPPGPWPLRRGYVATRSIGAILLAGIAVLFLATAGRGFLLPAEYLLDERALAAAMTGDVPATFERFGKPHDGWRGTGLFRNVRGKAVASIDGETVRVPVELELVLTSEAALPPLRVLHTNGTPRGLLTSWHVETHSERWLRVVLILAVIACMDAALWIVAWRMWRRARLAATVAYDGVEILAPYEVEMPQWWRNWAEPRLVATWQLDGVNGTQRLDPAAKRGLPPIASGGVLLLVSPRMPRHALVLDQRLRPLRLDDATVAAVHARIAAAFPDEPEFADDD